MSIHYRKSTRLTDEVSANDGLRLMQSPSPEATYRHLYYFNLFILKNTFNPKHPSYDSEIREYLGRDTENHLLQAVLAIGALEASKSNTTGSAGTSDHRSDMYSSLVSYSTSITALRDSMSCSSAPSRIQVLWTTLLLGLFEVSRFLILPTL